VYWAFPSLLRLAEGLQAWGDDHGEAMRPAIGLAVARAFSFAAYWTLARIPGFGSMVCLVDTVLFALYYRAIVSNANTMGARSRGG
jgi:hypothetical protein